MFTLRLVFCCLFSLSLFNFAHAQEDPNCPGAPLPRLSVGAQGRVVPDSLQSIMRDVGQGTGILGMIRAGNVFEVLDGPVCANHWNWWQIEYDTHVGWIIEGSGSEYWLEPYVAGESEVVSETHEEPALESSPTTEDVSVSSFNPPIAVVNVLEVGARARVLNDDPNAETVTLNIRADPGRSGARLAQALEGDLLTIVGGPEEVDGLRWWQVETVGGTEGWVIEGLVNPDRNDAYERTLLPICPAEGERIAFRLSDYIVTSAPDGSEPCVLDLMHTPAYLTFSQTIFHFENRLVASSDGEYFLYTDPVLYRLNRDGSERLPLTRSYIYWAAWSPDGERIAIATGDHIGMMRRDGSGFSTLTRDNAIRSWVAWQADSETLVYSEQSRWRDQMGTAIEYTFYRVNIREGGLRPLLRVPLEVDVRAVAVSPNGNLLAVSGGEYALLDGMSGTQPTKFYDLSNSIRGVTWIIDLEAEETILEANTSFYSMEWLPDQSALIEVDSYDNKRRVLPVNGDEPYQIELTGDPLPRAYGDFLGWESDSVFLIALGHGFSWDRGAEIDGRDFGIWAVNVVAGEVERRR